MPNPISTADRRRILRLHKTGRTRNQIAREVGRSPSTVSAVVAKAGRSFTRGEQVHAATKAKQVDNQVDRAKLVGEMLGTVAKLHGRFFTEHTAYSFGGRDNVYNEHQVSEPSYADKKAIAQTMGTLIDKVLRIEAVDSESQGLAAVDQWLRSMIGEQTGGD
jgi:orotate phosphoribosyltransferase-like protein